MMTGTGEMAEMRLNTARPCESGSCMSSRINEGWADTTRGRASSPPATVTTSKPSTERMAANESRDAASSSMIKMVGCPTGGSTPFSAWRNARVIDYP